VAPPKIELDGAVVAITGAGRGIGRATGEAFAARGATVCLGDLDRSSGEAAALQIGGRACAFALDVRSEASFRRFVRAVERAAGPIDVLVNNAGVMPTGRFLEESAATTATVMGVNVVGPVHGMRLVLPGMIERGRGHIVNVASMLGKTELPGVATYTASKHALVGLTAAVRSELAGTGVTLTVVLPGVVNTDLSSGIPIPFARLARVEPADVAGAIVGSVATRPREMAVPRWMALYPVLRPFIPDWVEALGRRLVGDDRALSAVDPDGRAEYVDRVARQVAGSARQRDTIKE
jgi:NADP-dependent 3-hydroxy acid dehydrogenase YdfG